MQFKKSSKISLVYICKGCNILFVWSVKSNTKQLQQNWSFLKDKKSSWSSLIIFHFLRINKNATKLKLLEWDKKSLGPPWSFSIFWKSIKTEYSTHYAFASLFESIKKLFVFVNFLFNLKFSLPLFKLKKTQYPTT